MKNTITEMKNTLEGINSRLDDRGTDQQAGRQINGNIWSWTENRIKEATLRDLQDKIMEKAMAPHSSTLAWKIPWTKEPGGLQSMGSLKSQTWLNDFTFTFHFHALEKEMATHSSVLAWRIPGVGEPGGLPSMGSHRVRHDWSDLAAAAAAGQNEAC